MTCFPWIRAWAVLAVALSLCSCAHCWRANDAPGVLHQTSLITALLEGCYDGAISCGELKREGDFGIGTFDRLDGEMILLDGQVFQAKSDGVVVRALDSASAPFAVVAKFSPRHSLRLEGAADLDALKRQLDALRPSGNLFSGASNTGVSRRRPSRIPNWPRWRPGNRSLSVGRLKGLWWDSGAPITRRH